MADKLPWKSGRLDEFHLGRRYKDIGGDLGRLYEAHNVHTGAPGLLVLLGARAEWDPKESWRVEVSSRVDPPCVVLDVLQAPATGQLPELSAMLDLMTSAVEQLERKDEARAHLTREPINPWRRWSGRMRRLSRSRRMMASVGLATVALGVALFLWPRLRAPASQEQTVSAPGTGETLLSHAPLRLEGRGTGSALASYPLPDKPFLDQAKPPCKPNRGEVELNGGCWIEVAKRPPCYVDHAEYQGKCYLPVGERKRLPQSLQP
ncbi:hypothetical protein [Archangium sp.]|uniref:hypothetical protein n=1 Tax=Archangium sp. TaxID=1872627 RepID=UPI00286AB4BC|nr:hypothetical protein [Archangium sp.]